MEDSSDQSSAQVDYTVVARRYRPKTFDQLIGQEHVAQALSQAIATGRVGHAYLFTGARGVGKTSSARIFAKVLNTPEGTSPELTAEMSAAIDAGEDMDVIEIDGASNRGINEIRQLRANVNVRPSRARFKIYIIDEVHMLTKEAFNALLKTLEEPPAHVKFIFCTTDPDKIPITVLSRCQRFDFAPVRFDAIVKRLGEIAAAEGYECESDALALLARRAAGSMRDSQSLLEQVMSFSVGKITAEQVHALLGVADESLLLSIAESLQQRDALLAISSVDKAVSAGTDAGQLSEQLLGYLRDIMAVGIGAGPELLKLANPTNYGKLQQLAQSWGLQTILSAVQILDESIVRMRASVSANVLLEVALVQICQLEQLASLQSLLAALNSASGGSLVAEKKKPKDSTEVIHRSDGSHVSLEAHTRFQQASVASVSPLAASSGTLAQADESAAPGKVDQPDPLQHVPSAAAKLASIATLRVGASVSSDDRAELDVSDSVAAETQYETSAPAALRRKTTLLENPAEVMAQWRRATQTIEGLLADYCSMVEIIHPTPTGVWRVVMPPGATQARDYCEQPARKSQLIAALSRELGRQVQLDFEVQPGQPRPSVTTTTSSTAERSKRIRELSNHPLVKSIIEVLDGEINKIVTSQPSSGASSSIKRP